MDVLLELLPEHTAHQQEGETGRRASWGAADGERTRHQAGRGGSRNGHRAAGPETMLTEREMRSLSATEKAKKL